ncbi:MAG: PepSY-associated TM helix domain-containing protein [Bacteroidota bacterium]
MTKRQLKKTSGKLHLYLGLASGLVVLIVALTGCCWVFQEEITRMVDGDRSVPTETKPFVAPTEAKATAATIFPDKLIHGTKYCRATNEGTIKPVEVIFYQAEPEFYQSVYLHPYSGVVMDTKDHRDGFFWWVLQGHLYLWLPPRIGTEIMRYGTMIFVILLITGIYLWWPSSRKSRKQRFTFAWKPTTRWRRKNFDLHSVVGFYVSLLALIIAFSGLIMAFNWIYFVTYKALGGDQAPQFVIPTNESRKNVLKNNQDPPIDRLLPMLVQSNPDYESLELHYPANDSSSIYVEVSSQSGVYYNSDYRFYDAYSLEELDPGSIYSVYKQASLADRVIRMNYDIHVGAIGGLPGKILAFIVSLVTASLPITGTLLWWGRKKKKRKLPLQAVAETAVIRTSKARPARIRVRTPQN